MGKWKQVIILEVEIAPDKSSETPGGKYRRDTLWLLAAFRNQGTKSEVRFITNKDTAESLMMEYPEATFLGRVDPMSYETISFDEYIAILNGFFSKGRLVGPIPEHIAKIGSKRILYDMRESCLGFRDVHLHTLQDMGIPDSTEIDRILPADLLEPRVLKMMQGSRGIGVWRLENKPDGKILLHDADALKSSLLPRNDVVPSFMRKHKGPAISMPYLPLVIQGEFKCLLSKNKVLDIVYMTPLDEKTFMLAGTNVKYSLLNLDNCRTMVHAIEKWTEELQDIMKMDDLPYWWSVDCIETEAPTLKPGQIPSINPGRRLVLSEINCSCLGLLMYSMTPDEANKKGMNFADIIADSALAQI